MRTGLFSLIKVRRVLAITGSTAILGGAALVIAPAATAADLGTFNAPCGNAMDIQNLSGQVGDTFRVTNTSSTVATCTVTLQGMATGSATIAAAYPPPGATQTYTITSTGVQSLTFVDSGTPYGLTLNLTVTSGNAGSSGASGPTPILQQFDRPTGSSCADTASVTLNWAGVGSGGWGNSWAQWANQGNGGPVCTRTLIYSHDLGTWILG